MSRSSPLYSAIPRRIYGESWFRSLSHLARSLYIYMRTGRHVTTVSGLWAVHEEQLAADFELDTRRFRAVFAEVCAHFDEAGRPLVTLDNGPGVLWMPGVLRDPCCQPANEKVLLGWIPHLEMVPDCEVKAQAVQTFRQWIMSQTNRFPNGIPNRFPNYSDTNIRARVRPSALVPAPEPARPPAPEPARPPTLAPAPPPAPVGALASEPPPSIEQVRQEKPALTVVGGAPSESNGIANSIDRVAPQEQEQEQNGSLSRPSAPAQARAEAPAAGRKENYKPDLTPTERCERSFTQPHASPEALTLFEAWRTESGKKNARLDHRRKELFERLVYECVSVEEVILTTRGAKRDEWASQKVHLDPAAILASAGQREKYMALEEAAAKEAEAVRNRYRVHREREIPPEKRVSPEEAQRSLDELNRRIGAPRIAKANGYKSPQSETLPVAAPLPNLTPAQEAEREAEHAQRAAQARAKLAEFDEDLQPALEA